MRFCFKLIIISSFIIPLEIFLTGHIVCGENLVKNGDFESSSSQTFIYDGVNEKGELDVGDNSFPAMADINGDGKKDLVVSSKEGLIYCYINQGEDNSPKFTSAEMFQPNYNAYTNPDFHGRTFLYIGSSLVDWNNDGKIDIIFGTLNGWIFLIKGNGDSSFGKRPKYISSDLYVRRDIEKIQGLEDLDIGQFAAPISVDWDGDKKKDIILGEGTYGADSVYIFLNRGGSPPFRKDERQYLAYGFGREYLTPAPIDWDDDGDLDLIVGEKEGYLNLYLNNPPERRVGDEYNVHVLEHSKRLSEKISYSAPSTVDWDNDGDIDILCGAKDGRIYLFLNQGSKGNPRFTSGSVLRGVDKRASFDAPELWTQDYQWEVRDGVYVLEAEETEPILGAESSRAKERCLKLESMGDYPGKIEIHNFPALHDDKKYLLTFYTKGKNVKASWCFSRWESQQVIVEGKRTHASKSYVIGPFDFSVSSDWGKAEKIFTVPMKENKTRSWEFSFFITGKGPFYLDKVSIQEVK